MSSYAGRPSYQLAGWGQRFGASVIDGLINLLPAGAAFWLLNTWSVTHGHFLAHVTVTDSYGQQVHVYGLDPLGWVVWLLVVSLSWGVLMGRTGDANGQTIGMRRLGIRVVPDDGHEMTGLQAVLRFLMQAVLLMMFLLPGLLDSLWALIDHENRTWHDLLCRTHVVQTAAFPPTWRP